MFVLSYVFLIECVHLYFAHILNIAEVFYGKKDKSGTASFYLGHIFLCLTIFFGTTFGWSF